VGRRDGAQECVAAKFPVGCVEVEAARHFGLMRGFVPILFVGRRSIDGRPCVLVMPFLETLDEFCRKRQSPPSVRQRCVWARQLIAALRTMHKRKTMHRDVKPTNIFLDENGSALLGDFGSVFTPEFPEHSWRVDGITRSFASKNALSYGRPCAADDFESLARTLLWLAGKSPKLTLKDMVSVGDVAVGMALQQMQRAQRRERKC
jgi:serine/threonine protein kinase